MTTLSLQESLNPLGKALVVNGQTVAVATEAGFEIVKGSLLDALLRANIVGSDVATPLNVVSYGSNANGNWVRFAGGLQVCFNTSLPFSSEGTSVAVGSIFASPDNLTWTFPSQFTSVPAVFSKCRSGITDAICGLGTQAYSATSYAFFRVYSPTQYPTATPSVYSCLAIGSWK